MVGLSNADAEVLSMSFFPHWSQNSPGFVPCLSGQAFTVSFELLLGSPRILFLLFVWDFRTINL